MNEEFMPPKVSKIKPTPQNIQSMLAKLKEMKDKSQLETILLCFYKIHSADPHIAAIFNVLGFDAAKQQFASALSFDKVVSLIENTYEGSTSSSEQCLNTASELDIPDSNPTIIKKPIPTSMHQPDNDQFLSNHSKYDKALVLQEGVYDISNASFNNTLLFGNNSMSLPQFTFSNKNSSSNDCLRVNSPFNRFIAGHVEEFKATSVEVAPVKTLLKKKRVKPPIVIADNEPSDNKRSMRPSSTAKKYKSSSVNKKKEESPPGRSTGFGLKEISNRVKEIIKRSGTTSYKEISDEIVNEINEKDSKDEKNIRRRIYDSLNVMKSMKLFKKDKSTKKIVWTFIDDVSLETSNDRPDEEIDHSDYIKALNQEIRIKEIKQHTLQKEYNSLNTVIERNKAEKGSHKEENKILFPFIIIEFPNNKAKESKVKVSMNETKTQAHFAFDSADKLYGDLDAISKIGANINQNNKPQ